MEAYFYLWLSAGLASVAILIVLAWIVRNQFAIAKQIEIVAMSINRPDPEPAVADTRGEAMGDMAKDPLQDLRKHLDARGGFAC